MDTDGDGCVTAVEVTNWLTKNKIQPDFGIVSAIMKYFDIDGDGQISLSEIASRSHEATLTGGMNCLPGQIKEKTPCLQRLLSNKPDTSTHVHKIMDVAKFLGKYKYR